MIPINNYNELISSMVDPWKDNDLSENKTKITEQFKSQRFFVINASEQQNLEIKFWRAIEKIADLYIGQLLLQSLLDKSKGRALEIANGEESLFSAKNLKTTISLSHLSARKDLNGRFYVHYSFKRSLVHELIHANHFFENEIKYYEYAERSSHLKAFLPLEKQAILLSDELENEEEQRTIMGIDKEHLDILSLCENMFAMHGKCH